MAWPLFQDKVFCVVATCGQGEFPENCKEFYKNLCDKNLPADLLNNVKFTTFGLGDSSYVYYNEAAQRIHERFEELGGQCVMPIGLGDDKDEDKFESAWNEWVPELWNELGTDPPAQELLPPTYQVLVDTQAEVPEVISPPG